MTTSIRHSGLFLLHSTFRSPYSAFQRSAFRTPIRHSGVRHSGPYPHSLLLYKTVQVQVLKVRSHAVPRDNVYTRRRATPQRIASGVNEQQLGTKLVLSSVCLSVCWSLHLVTSHFRGPRKTAEPIKVPLWVWTRGVMAQVRISRRRAILGWGSGWRGGSLRPDASPTIRPTVSAIILVLRL